MEQKLENRRECILVALPAREDHRTHLEKIAPCAEVIYCPAAEVTKELVWKADVILGNVPADMIQNSPNLRWLQLNNAGTEGYCTPGVLPEEAILTNATGTYGMAISEHMLAMLFMLQKRLDTYYQQQKNHNWKKQEHMMVVEGSTTLVIGLGDIGTAFAEKMHAMGSRVLGIRRTMQPKPDAVESQYTMEHLHELLPQADVVALSLPAWKETQGVIGKEELKLMKKTTVILNVGRGSAIDTDALSDALYTGEIFGAGLDVTDPEPLPPDHPIWNAPHTIITPHVSGRYDLPATLEKIWNLILDNLERWEKGRDLKNVIDLSTGYVKRI